MNFGEKWLLCSGASTQIICTVVSGKTRNEHQNTRRFIKSHNFLMRLFFPSWNDVLSKCRRFQLGKHLSKTHYLKPLRFSLVAQKLTDEMNLLLFFCMQLHDLKLEQTFVWKYNFLDSHCIRVKLMQEHFITLTAFCICEIPWHSLSPKHRDITIEMWQFQVFAMKWNSKEIPKCSSRLRLGIWRHSCNVFQPWHEKSLHSFIKKKTFIIFG